MMFTFELSTLSFNHAPDVISSISLCERDMDNLSVRMTKAAPLINSELLTTEAVECVIHLFLPASVQKKRKIL